MSLYSKHTPHFITERAKRHREIIHVHKIFATGHPEIVDGRREMAYVHSEIVDSHTKIVDGRREIAYGHSKIVDGHREMTYGHTEIADGHRKIVYGHTKVVTPLRGAPSPRRGLRNSKPSEGYLLNIIINIKP